MLLLGSLGRMEWRQLLWIAVCVLELAGNTVGSPTDTPTPTAMAMDTRGTSSEAAPGAPTASSRAKLTPDTSAPAVSLAASPTTPGLSKERTSPQQSQVPTEPLGIPLDPAHSSQEVLTSQSPAAAPSTAAPSTAAASPGSGPALSSSPAPSGHPPLSTATSPLHTARESPKPISCHNIKEVSDTGAICLQLNESSSCNHFLERKGSELWSAICEGSSQPLPSPCQIKLAKSEVDHDCLLLILVGERDPTTGMLQESHWEKFGIKSLKQGNVRNHQDFSQKTLIALVTSGLLLAFLGLAGYFLMKRRSWSPAAERLAEEPYYADTGSQGNSLLMMPSPEHPELQQKANLNGGTQENGTGQASSQNGHSGQQHSPADSQM